MVDSVDSTTRSRIMRAVKSKGAKSTERRFQALLSRSKIRAWNTHCVGVPGNPDVVFERQKIAVFLDGCFWHGCPKCYRRPASKRGYWDEKVKGNIARDKNVRKILESQEWRVLRFWEHELKQDPSWCMRILSGALADKGHSPTGTRPA